ncbi:hypothetical protein [Arthrobacter sp. ISL-72]|uniref:hypothetical protein n=1 Tax=Arthrobacter sp. ISL-72 TaxID=2819114 RepID=UPI001BEBB8EB|nr:hypothetical protein [Arthrobacter sp. ISL-72]MBT2596862.1 hypothetical protein [Arthrobacter sp. ISL-72]
MSTEHNEPEDIVNDGVEDETNPVPRDKPATQGSGRHAGPGPVDARPGETDGTKPPGPAEEQNSKSADDRGLTTEPSSSD